MRFQSRDLIDMALSMVAFNNNKSYLSKVDQMYACKIKFIDL